MKAILISIKPDWVAKILNGKKTIEIRKTMPKCDLPIDVYIYCTKDKNGDNNGNVIGRCYPPKTSLKVIGSRGKVVAKFTLNKVDEYYIQHSIYEQHSIYKNKEYHGELESTYNDIVDKGCISPDLVQKYLDLDELGEGTLFAWHISNLVIFDKPKELSEFYKIVETSIGYELTDAKKEKPIKFIGCKPLTKAPQSWQFIETGE